MSCTYCTCLVKQANKVMAILWFSQPLSLALGMTGLAHCLVKQARVHYGVHSGRIYMEVLQSLVPMTRGFNNEPILFPLFS